MQCMPHCIHFQHYIEKLDLEHVCKYPLVHNDKTKYIILYFFQYLGSTTISVPVASNHGNLYITLLALAVRELRSTHAEVNGTEEEKGENGHGNGDRNMF